jgi:hypothetical protein
LQQPPGETRNHDHDQQPPIPTHASVPLGIVERQEEGA